MTRPGYYQLALVVVSGKFVLKFQKILGQNFEKNFFLLLRRRRKIVRNRGSIAPPLGENFEIFRLAAQDAGTPIPDPKFAPLSIGDTRSARFEVLNAFIKGSKKKELHAEPPPAAHPLKRNLKPPR